MISKPHGSCLAEGAYLVGKRRINSSARSPERRAGNVQKGKRNVSFFKASIVLKKQIIKWHI